MDIILLEGISEQQKIDIFTDSDLQNLQILCRRIQICFLVNVEFPLLYIWKFEQFAIVLDGGYNHISKYLG